MTVYRIIFALFLGLISAQSARADTACGTLSHMVESIALVRQIQNDPGGPAYRARINRLNSLTTQISLADLIPADPAASRSEDRQAMSRYVSGLQTAVSGAMMGRDITARQTFETLITPAVFNGLSSFETHWDCSDEALSPRNEVDADTEAKTLSDVSNGDAENGPNRPANPTESTGNSGDLAKSVGDGNGTASGRDAIVTGNTMVFFIMLLGMTLVGGFFYAQSRMRRKTVRESRRALNASVDVKLDGQTYQMRLVDISMNGFKIGHAGQISEQDDIAVAIGGSWYDGNVRWANPHYAGVKFKRAIDPQTLSLAMNGPDLNAPLGATA